MDEQFKALGHEVRLTIYRALREEPLCVCELNELLDMSQSAVSQHISQLKQAGLIEPDRIGQWTFYHPTDGPFPEAIGPLFDKTPDELLRQIESIKQDNLCDIRDSNGNLQEIG